MVFFALLFKVSNVKGPKASQFFIFTKPQTFALTSFLEAGKVQPEVSEPKRHTDKQHLEKKFIIQDNNQVWVGLQKKTAFWIRPLPSE